MPFSVAVGSDDCDAHVVPNEWIEQTLKPQLAGVDTRQWAKGSLGPFMADLHQQLKAARDAGLLSREEEGTARDLIREAVKRIPGVTVVTETAAVSVPAGRATTKRRDLDE